MRKTLAMILAGGRVDELSVLTQFRPKSAVPFGGLYRVIDFPLSNLMHSGIENVGILPQYRSFSLINHIGDGSAWEMVGRSRGIAILPPYQRHGLSDWYRGNADAVYQNLGFIRHDDPELVLALSGDHIYSMNYSPLIRFHLESSADLTIVFTSVAKKQFMRFGIGRIDDRFGEKGGRLIEYIEKPKEPPDWLEQPAWASATIYLFSSSVLFEVLERHVESTPKTYEFGKDIIPAMLDEYKVFGYKFDDYWGYTRTIDEYWQTNMLMLDENSPIAIERWQVRTNLDHNAIRDRVPAAIGPKAEIENSLIYSGCRIDGRVKNSILFSGVVVEEEAQVEDSIIMFDTIIKSGSSLKKVITDGHVIVGKDSRIGFGESSTPNKVHPDLLQTGITLIGRGSAIPDHCRIGMNCIINPNMTPSHFRELDYSSGSFIH